MEAMKSKKLVYGSKGVMGGQGAGESWSDGLATDGTRITTDGEKTGNRELNRREQRERRLPAKEHRERKRSDITLAGGGKRRYANRAVTGLSGCEAGKSTGFYRIVTRCYRFLPHKSTQVVDFPRICGAVFFGEGLKFGFQNQTEPGTNQAGLGTNIPSLGGYGRQGWSCSDYCGNGYGLLRIASRKFTKVRIDQDRNSTNARKSIKQCKRTRASTSRGVKIHRQNTDRKHPGLFLLDGRAWTMYLVALEIELNEIFTTS